MQITDETKMRAVVHQLQLFTSYIARLQKEGRLTQEQDGAAMQECANLNAVIEDYRSKLGLDN